MSGLCMQKLGDVCDITMGQAPPGSTYNLRGDGLPLVAGAGNFGDRTPVTEKFTSTPLKTASPGDIILCVRATIGDINWSDSHYCLGRGVAGLRPKNNEELDSKFLWYWLWFVKPALRGLGKGATFLQVTKSDIENLKIPRFPLKEQRRIAEILEASDLLQARATEALTELEKLQCSVFLDMFGDPYINPKGWDTKLLGDSDLGRIVTGNTPPTSIQSYYGGSLEWLKSNNLRTDGTIATRAEKHLSEKGRTVARVVPAGSVLVTCIAGSPNVIGSVALVDREVAFNQQIYAVVPSEKLQAEYLLYLFRICPALVQRKSSKGLQGLVSKSAFASIKIPLPSTQAQKRFVEFSKGVERTRDRFMKFQSEAERLMLSLQSKAFKGEI